VRRRWSASIYSSLFTGPPSPRMYCTYVTSLPFWTGRRPSMDFQIEGWTTSSSLFRRQWAASAWMFFLSMPLIVRWYMLQISGGKSGGRLRRLLRPRRPIQLSSNQFRMGVSSFASWLDKASKASSKLSVGTNASATIILTWRANRDSAL